jgi:hypothetical protein
MDLDLPEPIFAESSLMLRSFFSLALIAAMAAMVPGASAFSPAQPVHPAGCHGHAPAPPSHSPVSFQCCASRHHAAMPATMFRHHPAMSLSDVDAASRFLVFPVEGSAFVLRVTLAGSPPGAAPLRI